MRRLRPRQEGIVVLGIHLALVCSVAGVFEYERLTLPRAIAPVQWFGPPSSNPGRYLFIRACPEKATQAGSKPEAVRLHAVNGVLTADEIHPSDRVHVIWANDRRSCLTETTTIYVPDAIALPKPGAALWAEFSVSEGDPPRPIRLGKMQDGRFVQLGQ